jgi:hypothetical protein
MAWGQAKRSGYNPCCTRRGKCSCQRRNNAAVARKPEAAPHACTKKCTPGKACGAMVRGGVCPCPYC